MEDFDYHETQSFSGENFTFLCRHTVGSFTNQTDINDSIVTHKFVSVYCGEKKKNLTCFLRNFTRTCVYNDIMARCGQ